MRKDLDVLLTDEATADTASGIDAGSLRIRVARRCVARVMSLNDMPLLGTSLDAFSSEQAGFKAFELGDLMAVRVSFRDEDRSVTLLIVQEHGLLPPSGFEIIGEK